MWVSLGLRNDFVAAVGQAIDQGVELEAREAAVHPGGGGVQVAAPEL